MYQPKSVKQIQKPSQSKRNTKNQYDYQASERDGGGGKNRDMRVAI